jgi:hypothetical protein
MKIVGLAQTPREIAGLLDARKRELGLSNLALDDIAGIQQGYSSKVFAGVKGLGSMSLPALLGALGVRLAVVADDDLLPAATIRHWGSVAQTPNWRTPPKHLPPPGQVFVAVTGFKGVPSFTPSHEAPLLELPAHLVAAE